MKSCITLQYKLTQYALLLIELPIQYIKERFHKIPLKLIPQ